MTSFEEMAEQMRRMSAANERSARDWRRLHEQNEDFRRRREQALKAETRAALAPGRPIVLKVRRESEVIFDRSFQAGRRPSPVSELQFLTIPDHYASPQHAQFTRVDGHWYISDLGSTNGTYHLTWWNEPVGAWQRIQSATLLQRGDQLRIGRTIITVVPV